MSNINKVIISNNEVYGEFTTDFAGNIGISDNTVKSYLKDIEQFKEYCNNKEIYILDCTKDEIEEFVQSNNSWSGKTKNRKLSSIRKFYKNFVLSEKIKDNPASKIKRSKEINRVMRHLSEEETVQFLDDLDKDIKLSDFTHGDLKTKNKVTEKLMISTLFELMYGCGLRVSEICELKRNDINDDSIKILGKGSKERSILLNQKSIDKLSRYLSIRNDNSPYVFINKKGEKLTRQYVYRKLKKELENANIDPTDFSPHSLRHSLASHLIGNGTNLLTVQKILGHADVSTTQKYLDFDYKEMRETYDKAMKRK